MSATAKAMTEPASKRRKSSPINSKLPTNAFHLPPPPTRLRKIIQMRPKSEAELHTNKSATQGSEASIQTESRGKGSSAMTRSGRKVARKTAHSLIERRRRSKMNEEFGVLRDMIPACAGQDMHKLAILQATIEYMRYLEQCVQDLKLGNGASVPSTRTFVPQAIEAASVEGEEDDVVHGQILAEPMQNEYTQPQNHTYPFSDLSSPVIEASLDYGQHHVPKTPDHLSTSPMIPSEANPSHPHAFGPVKFSSQRHLKAATPTTGSARHLMHPTSGLSPLLGGLLAEDHEATTALLMLGSADRQGATGGGTLCTANRGLSVKDLLS